MEQILLSGQNKLAEGLAVLRQSRDKEFVTRNELVMAQLFLQVQPQKMILGKRVNGSENVIAA